jgi:TPR repeat protein
MHHQLLVRKTHPTKKELLIMNLTENYKQILREYLKAQQGDAEAQYRLGFRYFKGHGVRPDYQKAFQWR